MLILSFFCSFTDLERLKELSWQVRNPRTSLGCNIITSDLFFHFDHLTVGSCIWLSHSVLWCTLHSAPAQGVWCDPNCLSLISSLRRDCSEIGLAGGGFWEGRRASLASDWESEWFCRAPPHLQRPRNLQHSSRLYCREKLLPLQILCRFTYFLTSV